MIMEFAITRESNLEGAKNKIVQDLSDDLHAYFKQRNYGESIKSFIIHLICVKPEFDFFFKIRKPRYVDKKTEVRDGVTVEIIKHFGYDIKIAYEAFVSVSDEDSLKMLVREIVISLSHLDSFPKKVKGFDKEYFKSDLESFFKLKGLM